MHHLNFDKMRMQEIMEAVRDGKPLSPNNPSGWSGDDMMHVAAGMLAAILSQGPMRLPGQLSEFGEGELGEAMADDDRQRFVAEVALTAVFASNLAIQALDGNLPDDFGDISRFGMETKGQLPAGRVTRVKS